MGSTAENIICFCRDWSEDPTSNNHVMSELAQKTRVLWLNSVSTRRPKLSSKRDIKKIFSKVMSFFHGAKEVRPNLWVYTPIVIPLPHNKWAAVVNRFILKLTLGRLRRRLGMNDFQLWSFIPSVGDYYGRFGESVSVYYCTDDWPKFTYVDGPKTAQAERLLIARADIVFATAQTLVDDRKKLNPETHLARHGVDHALFAAALGDAQIPSDVATIKQPILGFYGTLHDWIDFDLIEYLAAKHPEWSIVLIGKSYVDTSRLNRYPNVHLLGRRSHADLHKYCRAFAVGIIPYILNERILHVNPVKLREYLSAGLPVVSTALPEVKQIPRFCASADTFAEFEFAVKEAIKNDSPELRQLRSDSMRTESWSAKVSELVSQVTRVRTRKAMVRTVVDGANSCDFIASTST